MGRLRTRVERLERLPPGGVESISGDGTTVAVDNSDPEHPVVSAAPALATAEAYTDAAIAALPSGVTVGRVRRISSLRAY